MASRTSPSPSGKKCVICGKDTGKKSPVAKFCSKECMDDNHKRMNGYVYPKSYRLYFK